MPYRVGNIVRKGEIASNFSFSHNVFYGYISLVRQNVALCGNGLIYGHKIVTHCRLYSYMLLSEMIVNFYYDVVM